MNDNFLLLPPKEFYAFELSDLANASDEEFDAMVQLNLATTDWVNSKISTADYSDILEWYDIDSGFHLKDVVPYFECFLKS